SPSTTTTTTRDRRKPSTHKKRPSRRRRRRRACPRSGEPASQRVATPSSRLGRADRAAEPRRHARRTAPTPSSAPARAWTARPGESVPGEIVVIGRAPPVLGHATVGHETGARIETDGPTI
ncbi:unnamed protein product, partial [Ixodes pacificus]